VEVFARQEGLGRGARKKGNQVPIFGKNSFKTGKPTRKKELEGGGSGLKPL